ncbi:hypothetical protein EV401DRAFT_1885169 [Pisolithus croceorrhizus]|nr:hypothetical protein EV401DRAFT_1885169 [Pisolithus croceorrhizus]
MHYKGPAEGSGSPVQSQVARVKSPEGSGEIQQEGEARLESLMISSLQDSSKLLKAPRESSRSQALEVDGIEVAMAEPSSSPLVKGRYAQDEPRADEQPIEAVALTLKVPKPTPEPRDDLCGVPEQAGHTKVEEIKSEVEVERQSKVVAWRKPPEEKIQRKTLKSVTWRIKEILPGFWITHCTAGMDLESWCRDTHNKSECTYDAAMKIYAGLSYKSKNYLFEGYEILGGKVKAPHSGGWSTILKPTAISDTQKLTEEAVLRVRTPQILCMKKQTPPCFEGGAQRLLYGVLHRVFEATRLGIKPNLKHMKVFEGSNQLKTPSKLSFRFQGAVVPSMSSTELKGSSI